MAETHKPPEEFTLRLRRYDPESGEAPYWDEHTIELEPHRSVLEAILQAKDRFDGSIGIRCSCRAAICGSCGVRINGEPGARLPHAPRRGAAERSRDGVIEVEPMGNMPVIKDLIVDMDAVHWKKIQRVTPWLLAKQPVARARVHRRRASRWSTSRRRWPASSAAPASRTAWRWRSTRGSSARPRWPRPTASSATRATPSSASASTTSPRTRTASTTARTASSASRPARRASPRWARSCACAAIAGDDHHIDDRNNGERHEAAFVDADPATTACCARPSCCRAPTAATRGSASSTRPPARSCSSSLPVVIKALLRGKVTPGKALLQPQASPRTTSRRVQAIYDKVEGKRRALRAEPVHHRRATRTPSDAEPAARRRRRERRADEGRLLARLREPRLHPRAARLDGARSRRCSTSSWSSSTAPAAAAPA